MIAMAMQYKIMRSSVLPLNIDNQNQVIVFKRKNLIFAFNFSPDTSHLSYFIPTQEKGDYKVSFSTDRDIYGGFGRISEDYLYSAYETKQGLYGFEIYIPARTALCVKKVK
jgi:1,4-alpha-glucan branching enzyme